jgi:MoaA/NifB/PqqE/SkfB family radical SAM enzyme
MTDLAPPARPHWRVAEAASPRRPLVLDRGPRALYIETSNRCNSLCQTCPLTFYGSQGGAHDLSYEEFRRVVDQVPDLERVVLHGIGEPLLNRHLPAMIRHLKERGVHTLFNSNAILLTRKWREAILASGLNEFRASLDAATPETYRLIRGVPLHGRVVQNLGELVATRRELGQTGPKISVWFTAMRENLDELPDVARLVAGIGFAASGGNDPRESLHGDEATAARPWMSCNRPWYLAYVTAHGDMLPCCFAPFITTDLAPVTLGNVLRDSLASVWNGAAYQEFRRRFQTDTPASICAGCGSKWSV